ncbi:MAG: FTR1 family protein [Anaerolineales bacterium]|nr:FTR1 family protein [Anaerolineales bacterium]
MLPSYLLSLREGLEAALIIGIALGALQKIRRSDLVPALWFGALSATIVSFLCGILFTLLGLNLEGATEKIYEGFAMFIAAGILTWMVFWMGKQARNLKSELEDGVNKAAASSGKASIFWLAFIAVAREGIELALFLTAAFLIGNNENVSENTIQSLAGVVLGLGTAILFGWSLLSATARLNLKPFFQVTGYLLILFAAGLVAHGIHEFNEIGWIPSIVEHIWDINSWINEDAVTGQLLKTLFGYNGNPSLTEIVGYIIYITTVTRLFSYAAVQREITAAQPQA